MEEQNNQVNNNQSSKKSSKRIISVIVIIAVFIVTGISMYFIMGRRVMSFSSCANELLGGGSFTLKNVKRIELGDDRYDVRNYLGEPDEGEEYATTWVYYGSNYKSLMAQDEKLQEDLLNASSEKEVENILKKMLEIEESLANLTYNYCVVTFDGSRVLKVEFDAKKSESGESNSKTSKTVSLSMDTLLLYTDLSNLDLTEKIDYTDGSYKLDKLPQSVISDINTAQLGENTLSWSDGWAEYTHKVTVAETINLSSGGINYKLALKEGSTAENSSVVMTVSGKKEVKKYNHPYKEIVDEIIIQSGITTLGEDAFNGYHAKSVTIPASIKKTYGGAFGGYIEKVYISDLKAWCAIDFYNKYSGTNPMEGGADLYLNGELITDLIIPSGLKKINDYTFCGGRFSSVTIPDSVTSIGGDAFAWCENITSITIPDSVTSIGEGAFGVCSSLTSVSFGKNSKLKSIGIGAFANTALTSITIPSSVTSIGMSAFQNTELTSVIIPDGITVIDWDLFSGCSNLESIVIPKSVTAIEEQAFYHCINLKNVYYKGTEEQWNKIPIANTYNNNDSIVTQATIYYYSESNPGENAGNFWHYVDGEPVAW